MDGGSKLVFLPESHTDFPLSVSIEVWIAGLVALALVAGLILWLRKKRRS